MLSVLLRTSWCSFMYQDCKEGTKLLAPLLIEFPALFDLDFRKQEFCRKLLYVNRKYDSLCKSWNFQ